MSEFIVFGTTSAYPTTGMLDPITTNSDGVTTTRLLWLTPAFAPVAGRPDVRIKRFGLSFNWAPSVIDQAPVEVQLIRWPKDGTDTPDLTAIQYGPPGDGSLCHAGTGFTSYTNQDPGTGKIIVCRWLQPFAQLEYVFPPGDELVLGTSTVLMLQILTKVEYKAISFIHWEE